MDFRALISIVFFRTGEPARYKIRYAESQSSVLNYRYTEVDGNTIQTITGLQLGTPYVISVMAQNKIGKSAYSSGINVVTSSKLVFFPSYVVFSRRTVLRCFLRLFALIWWVPRAERK